MADLNTDVLERLTVVSPFGARFWDQVTQKTIGDGLSVTAYPTSRKDRRVSAVACRSGVFAFRGLPGMFEVESGAGDQDFWSNVASRSFVIEVQDTMGRFIPFCFEVGLPCRDAFNWQDPLILPLEAPLGVPLFSAAGRTPPASVAVLRGYLSRPEPQALVTLKQKTPPVSDDEQKQINFMEAELHLATTLEYEAYKLGKDSASGEWTVREQEIAKGKVENKIPEDLPTL